MQTPRSVCFHRWNRSTLKYHPQRSLLYKYPTTTYRAGGFRPSEHYQSTGIIAPGKGENGKYLKPPPSYHCPLVAHHQPGNLDHSSNPTPDAAKAWSSFTYMNGKKLATFKGKKVVGKFPYMEQLQNEIWVNFPIFKCHNSPGDKCSFRHGFVGFPFSRNHTYLIRMRSYWREVRSCEIDCPRLNQPASQSETNYNHRSKASYTPKIDSKKTCNLIVGRRTFLFGAKKTGFAISSLETSQQQVNYHGFFHWRCFRPTKKTT